MNTEVFSFLSFSSCLSGTSTQNFLKIAWICACAKSVVNFVMRRRESIVCHGGLLILVHRGSLVGFFKSWASFEECVFLRLLYFAVPFPISFRNEHNMKTIANIWGVLNPSRISKHGRNKMKETKWHSPKSAYLSKACRNAVCEVNLQRSCMPHCWPKWAFWTWQKRQHLPSYW